MNSTRKSVTSEMTIYPLTAGEMGLVLKPASTIAQL